ncbi:MAG: hypothetical protein E7394_08945 [Ruminococcaceae bacterium]|nr:hypothetical protein [Oscillospiraceae bacterium]
MKKILTVLLGALMLVMGLSLCASAADGFSIISAADHAIGESGVAIYISDIPEGTEKIVFTINGVDCEPTLESPYVATIGYGLNEIYATAYGMDDELYAVTNTIEIYGNDYTAYQSIANHDFDNLSASQTIYSYTPTAADKSTVTNQKIDIGGDHKNVAWMKTENWVNREWSASRPELHTPDTNWFSKATDKNTFVYEIDVMPIQVGKEQILGTFYYRNSGSENKTFSPITFTDNGKVRVATSITSGLAGAPAMPEFDAPANEWITFRIIMDSVNEKILIVANDVVYSSFGFDSVQNSANAFDFSKTAAYCRFPVVIGSGGVPQNKPLEFYIDNIKYSASNCMKRYAVLSSTVTHDGESEGLDGFPLSGGKIKLEFSEEMAEIKKEDIVLEVNGDAISFDLAFDSDTNIAIITPLYTFIGREICKLSFENVKTAEGAPAQKTPSIEFTSALPPCAIAECTAGEIVPGENTEFSVTVRNTLPDDKDAMILLGLYKDGGLESVIARDAFCPTGEDTDFSTMLYIPEDYDTSGYKIVAYLVYKDSFYIIDSFEYQV